MKPADAALATPAKARVRGQLFRKYFLLILALVCGALLISGGVGFYFAYQENKAMLASLQREKAVGAAARIEQFVSQIEHQLAFAALPQLGVGGVEQRRLEFLKLLRVVPAVTDVAQLDGKGREQLAVSRLAMDVAGGNRDRSQEPAFKNARPGRTWYGPVYFRKETEPYMSIAMRTGGPTGPVTVAEVNLKFIWDVVSRIRIGEKGKAYVVDATGYLIADPDIGLVLRKTDLSGLEQVKAALQPDADDSLAMLASDLAGVPVLTAWAPIEPAREQASGGGPPSELGWKVFVEQPVSEVFSALDATILRTVVLIVAGLFFSALAAMYLARSMVRPIGTLQEGAARIGAGDLAQKLDVRTGDELEALAAEFNRMTGRLRESYTGLERKVEERTAELKETLDQQTATSEILKVISSSTTDVQPVLEAIVSSAAKLFSQCNAFICMRDGDRVQLRAMDGAAVDARLREELGRVYPVPFDPAVSSSARAMAERRPNICLDTQAPDVPEHIQRAGRAARFRSSIVVPLVRDGEGIGTIVLTHPEPGYTLSDKHVALLRTFADQAVIAIENVRLFNETKESLEQQTAIAEVLRVISSSPTDVQPVFEAIVQSAARLFHPCRASFVLRDGDLQRWVASAGPPEAAGGVEALQAVYPLPFDPKRSLGAKVMAEGRTMEILDTEAPGMGEIVRKVARAGRFRSAMLVPLMHEGRGIGLITLSHPRPGFRLSERQLALLRTFADQAVIAIENVRLFREIEDKTRQLEIANQHKSDFLANMSHELRTPLNAIIGFSEVLMERMFGEVNQKQLDYLKDIHESGRHLLSLINDILDLSKIEAGRMELDLSTFSLPAALSNALTLIRERAQRHGIELSLEVDKAVGEFHGDERKFKQIMLNLLSNAVKFTPDGGRVDVRARRFDRRVEVAVRDTGIGIAPEDHAAVFEEFKQVGRDYTRKAEGTGLGLALTRRFVELHGGEIRLESALGKGSTFTITLPVGT